uniref:TTF-type domain-containing protein n=1 Tax=Amphimedon queenslandica TaxID=400682 RepID=A0A1X7V4R6_AMPQE
MSRQLTLFHSIQLNQGDGGSSSSTVIEPDASDCPSSTNPHGVESTTVSSNVGSNESCSVEEEESLNIDIASGPHENPVQPINHPFPFTMISKKARCFNAKWYQQYEWIQYSIAKDAVFCYSCCLFCHASNKAEDCFVTLGFRDWKHASRKGRAFAKHDTSKSHQEALMNWNQFKVTVATGSSIATRLDSARKEQIKKNRHYLIAIIHSLMYCASQEIALRGHRETPSVSNQGNFLELVKLLAMYDPIIHDRLTSGPQNALYTSHSIQNQLLHILGEKIRNSICHQVRSAGVFIILADETKDFSKQEQMCFVVRYADMAQGKIYEHFLTYVEAKSLDATSLSTYIKKLLLKFDLDYSKIVSQGYDGASVIE